MKQSQVSSFKFQVEAAAVAGVNVKLQTSDFKRQAIASLVLIGVLLASGAAWAQIVTDPTRPPGFVAGEAEAGAEAGGGLVLQSVMISPTSKAAIINGEMVKLGGKYGDAVLVKVAEHEVVLKSGDSTQVLKMYPSVEKRDIAPAAVKGAPRRGKAPQSGADPAATGSPSPR